MSSTNTQIIPHSSSSSSSKSTHQFIYEVFLSFRGEDTRYGFTDHLHEALISHGIHTFRDDEDLERGGVIAAELLHAIEESNIFVIIFSENYATSRWCLDELVKISEYMAAGQRLILPIFYHVDPSEVRKQTGSYKKAFDDHEKEAAEEKREKIQKWRTALTKVGNLAGYVLQKYGYEAGLIKKITYDIRTKLNCKFLYVSENIVGMDFRLEQLKSFIDIESNDVRMVGIYGLGGIGKTAISKVVYNNISHQFESSIFLENVRERSKDSSSLLQLQKELLNCVMKEKNLEISNVDEGIIVIQNRFSSKKILVILDDVDKLEQLNSLAGKHAWFGVGSRIIITSRDQHLLTVHEVDALYEVKALKHKESLQLFCQHAFKQNIPKNDYIGLSNDVVDYVKGLPLALKVLGSFLFSKSVSEWESALEKLKTNPNMEVQNVLKISFDGLDEMEKDIFLDVACFFRGWNKNDVVRLLEHAMIGIRVLSDKCLITLSGNTISMHDLVQEMGREIVRHEHPKEPRKWSRLWDPKDIRHALTTKEGTRAIEGIFLDMSRSREISFSTEAFKEMTELRLLKFFWSNGIGNYMGKESQKLFLPKDFEFPSHNLRYLHWEGYPLKSLPANFDGENLIELNLKHSNMEQLWQGKKVLEKLKILTLQSHQLKEIPHSSIRSMKNLTLLNLSWCTKIRSLPSTIKYLASLESLYLDGTAIQDLPVSIDHLTRLHLLSTQYCKNLRSLPSSICKLKSLKYLHHRGCSNLVTFPEIMEDMECLDLLDLSGTGIKEIPSTIEHLNHLNFLWLVECKNLRSFPTSIFRLKSHELSLYGCSNLEIFPEIKEDMKFLKNLDLSGTSIKELPSSIGYLQYLTSLRLENCKNLRSLPSSICKLKSLEHLSLYGCSNLEIFPEIMMDMEFLKSLDLSGTGIKELPSSIRYLNNLASLHLKNCKNLRSLPGSICWFKSLTKLYLSGCPNIVTEDMENLRNLGLSEIQNLMDREIPSDSLCLSPRIKLDLSKNNMHHIPAVIPLLSSLGILDISLEKIQSHLWWLSLLEELDLRKNNLHHILVDIPLLSDMGTLNISRPKRLKVIRSDLWCLSSLIELDLSNNNMHHIPAAITRLYNLEGLNISHCKMLEEIPELPSSLKEIDAHGCTSLGILSNPSSLLWSSLLKWFKKVESRLEWGSINLGSNGIPGWVSHQEMGSQIRIKLPMNWYQDDHFLGFAFFCLHQPNMDSNSSLGAPGCECYWVNDSELDEVWVVYYPKISIPDKFHSNQYIHLKASFNISLLGCSRNIKSCGIHLIYSQYLPQNLLENSGDNRLKARCKRLRKSNTHPNSISTHYKLNYQNYLNISLES